MTMDHLTLLQHLSRSLLPPFRRTYLLIDRFLREPKLAFKTMGRFIWNEGI